VVVALTSQNPAPRPAIPPTVWLLGLVSLFMDISSEMIQTLLPVYLASGLGVSMLAIGFIEGLSVAIATATRFFSGVLADWTQRSKPLAVLGYGLAAMSRLIFPLATTVDLVILGKAMDRIGKGIRSTPRDAMVAAATPAEIRGASFGLRKSLDTVGGFIGPIIAVLLMLALADNVVAVFWWAALPAFIALAILIFAVREPEGAAAPKRSRFRLADAFTLNRAVWLVIGLASMISLARFSEAFVILKAIEAGWSPALVPLAMVLMHAVYGLCAYPVGKLSDRIGNRGLLVTSLVFLLIAHLILAFAGSVAVFILGTLFWGLHMGFSQGLLGAMIAGATPDHLKGSAFGTFNLVTGLVMLLGNTLAGFLWQSGGPAVPFLLGGVISLGAIGLLLLRRAERPTTT
jgi:MFS family permease